MSLWNRFTLSNSKVLRVFLIVSDFCIPFPNLVDHRSAYLWPTSFERQGDVVWKSWLFPHTRSSFRARCWVPMKRLQRSCAKLKLCTGLATRAAYLKPRPRHPASVESNSLRQEWAINVWSVRLSLTPLRQSGRAEAASYRGAAHGGGCVDGNHRDPTRTQQLVLRTNFVIPVDNSIRFLPLFCIIPGWQLSCEWSVFRSSWGESWRQLPAVSTWVGPKCFVHFFGYACLFADWNSTNTRSFKRCLRNTVPLQVSQCSQACCLFLQTTQLLCTAETTRSRRWTAQASRCN